MKLSPFTSAILCLFITVGQAVAQPSDNFGNDATEHVFNNARIIVGDGAVIERGAVLVRGGVILAIGPAAGIDISDSAISHDLSGKTIMPALVNTHAHLGWEAYGDWGSQFFTEENLTDHLYRHAYHGVGIPQCIHTAESAIERLLAAGTAAP